MRVLLFAVLSAAFTFTPAVTRAGVWYVAPTGEDGNAGSAEKPFATINRAITSAAEGDEIRIQAGTYVENVVVKTARLVLRGGYGSDWARNLKIRKTIVHAADEASPVFFSDGCLTAEVSGMTLAGGSFGYRGNSADKTFRPLISQCAISNNVCGIRLDAHVDIVSSLIARNSSYGVFSGGQNMRTCAYNCTLADNGVAAVDGAAFYQNGEYAGTMSARNCVFLRNKYDIYHLWTYSSRVTFRDVSFFGATQMTEFGKVSNGTYNGWANTGFCSLFYGRTYQTDPGMDADYRPTAGSLCIKSGGDLSAETGINVSEDLEGEAWNGAYDLGCFKSSSPEPTVDRRANTYVATDGLDTNDGFDAEHPKKTLQEALYRTAIGGTIHVAAGDYTADCLIVATEGVRIQGEGAESTRLTLRTAAVSSSSYCPVYIAAHNVTVADMTINGGSACVGIMGAPVCTNALVCGCVLTNGFRGVFIDCAESACRDGWHRVSRCKITKSTNFGILALSQVIADNTLVADSGREGVITQVMRGPSAGRSHFINCTIANSGLCGYYRRYDGVPTDYLENCAFVGNNGAGIRDDFCSNDTQRYLYVLNCSFWGNAGEDIVNNRTKAVPIVCNKINGDPVFGDEAKGEVFVPQLGSALVMAGTNATLEVFADLATDIEGWPRRNLRRPDVGCYQHRYVKGLSLLIR